MARATRHIIADGRASAFAHTLLASERRKQQGARVKSAPQFLIIQVRLYRIFYRKPLGLWIGYGGVAMDPAAGPPALCHTVPAEQTRRGCGRCRTAVSLQRRMGRRQKEAVEARAETCERGDTSKWRYPALSYTSIYSAYLGSNTYPCTRVLEYPRVPRARRPAVAPEKLTCTLHTTASAVMIAAPIPARRRRLIFRRRLRLSRAQPQGQPTDSPAGYAAAAARGAFLHRASPPRGFMAQASAGHWQVAGRRSTRSSVTVARTHGPTQHQWQCHGDGDANAESFHS